LEAEPHDLKIYKILFYFTSLVYFLYGPEMARMSYHEQSLLSHDLD
jgi:hypothetical protein